MCVLCQTPRKPPPHDRHHHHPSAPPTLSHHYSHRQFPASAYYHALRITSKLLRAAIIAAGLPLVEAETDSGDDFSNNLIADLAPILALFGDQVAKQYLSQSTSTAEHVIFATAPLGIITAITAAIRVDGGTLLKAGIGRARESKGTVEMELMSSTSQDVCELWNGDGIVRVLGAPSIIELYWDASSSGNDIHRFKTAKESNIIWPRKPSVQSNDDDGNGIAPNLTLNLSPTLISRLELVTVAAIEVILQVGVLLWAGLAVYCSPWSDKFHKSGEKVGSHAYPTFATGTVALLIAMFTCAHIVERRTVEKTWEFDSTESSDLQVAWLQKGGVVNDQQFKSYLIKRIYPASSRHGTQKYAKFL